MRSTADYCESFPGRFAAVDTGVNSDEISAEERESETVAKKKTAKEIKRLKKRYKEATAASQMLEKLVRKLKKKLDAREKQIADLQGMLGQKPPASEATNSTTAEFGDGRGINIVSRHRSAWKQHSYLRDRYEFHLGAGATKKLARHLANEDLEREYGTGCGYTEEELTAILS